MQETITTWATDPTTVGPIYPFVGSELFLVIICVVIWILYTLWQLKFEHVQLAEELIQLQQEKNLADIVTDNPTITSLAHDRLSL